MSKKYLPFLILFITFTFSLLVIYQKMFLVGHYLYYKQYSNKLSHFGSMSKVHLPKASLLPSNVHLFSVKLGLVNPWPSSHENLHTLFILLPSVQATLPCVMLAGMGGSQEISEIFFSSSDFDQKRFFVNFEIMYKILK